MSTENIENKGAKSSSLSAERIAKIRELFPHPAVAALHITYEETIGPVIRVNNAREEAKGKSDPRA